ncbi:MAG: hypothetical protein K2M82_04455 [Lachnospiraceae bacterium]|nr:hypothetical protein [Lachnospiraceae bacterium]
MATSSLYANVKIKDKSSCQKLVKALEHSKASKGTEVKFSRSVERVQGEKIKELFK